MFASALAILLLAFAGCADRTFQPAHPPTVAELYSKHCASCHGNRRFGGYAPPLIPQTLGRRSDDDLARAVAAGLPNTQMPAFEEILDTEEIAALVALAREPQERITWSAEDIAASRVEVPVGERKILPDVRRENLILVVERGTASVSVLDGDRMAELDRFVVGQIHGGLKFDRSLSKALASTRDGTLVEYDLTRGGLRTKVKVGVNTRNVAISPDGEFVAVANQLPASLVVLDGSLRPLKVLPLPGQPSAVYHLPGRERFVLTLRDTPLMYTVRTSDLAVETLDLPEPFEDFMFVPGADRIVASSRGGSQLLLWDTQNEQVVGTIATQGLPHLFSACFFEHAGRLHAAFNHMGAPRLSIIDMQDFRVAAELPLLGPGFFTRTHPETPYIWVDTNTESIQLVEKKSLRLMETVLTPEPGKKAMHVEFTVDGDKALVSVWDDDGALIIYDSRSLGEISRMPYAMPVGKYNAGNKTRELH
jgi:mono/diheme cytochrome c family protein/WD40 repeat protein